MPPVIVIAISIRPALAKIVLMRTKEVGNKRRHLWQNLGYASGRLFIK